jgi:predicted DsbA family dithiol-disulfide isomerase
MASYKGRLDFEVVWHPFQLNPGAAFEGVDKMAFYRSKVG